MTQTDPPKPTPETPPSAAADKSPRRRLGTLKGKIHVPDDFDDPLPDDILAEFEGR